MKVSWHLSLLLCGGTLIGCGDSGATTEVASTTPAPAATTVAASTTPAAATAVAAADLDPILVGLLEEYEDLPAEFAEIKTAYEQKPTDAESVLSYIGTVEDLGMMHAQRGNIASADAAFIRASKAMTKALASGTEMEAGELPAIVFYNHACVLGKNQKSTEALAILGKAVDNGFSNVEQIKVDEDLAGVRALPAYDTQLVAWEQRFEEMQKEYKLSLKKKAREQLAKGESFEFDFDLVDVNGKKISKADLNGRVAIVDIWGTWCPPCRQEIPAFVKLQDKYSQWGFQMVGLNQERGPSEEANIKTVQDFTANNSVNYPCAIITDEILAQLPEFQGYPTTLFIDHHGKVRMKSVGFHEYEFMAEAVETLLKEQSAEARASTN